jgi:hypothetical protein
MPLFLRMQYVIIDSLPLIRPAATFYLREKELAED